MPISEEQVAHVARLAKLHLTPDELHAYSRELVTIIAYVDRLMAVDTKGIEVRTHECAGRRVFREDEVRPSLPVAEVMKNAPEKKDNYFLVPRVM